MAQPIRLEIPPRDPQRELEAQLARAPQEHAAALLAGYELLQTLHDRGVLEIVRGTVGGGEKILENAVAVAGGPAGIRAARNLILLITALSEVDPNLLSDLTRALPKALVQASTEEAKPAGFFKLVFTFWNKDFRRGLAAFSDLLVMFGRNLSDKTSQP